MLSLSVGLDKEQRSYGLMMKSLWNDRKTLALSRSIRIPPHCTAVAEVGKFKVQPCFVVPERKFKCIL